MTMLTEEQRQHFEREGYLVVEDVLDPLRDFAPIMSEYSQILDGLTETLFHQGAIASTYRDLSICERLIAVRRDSGMSFSQYFDMSLPQNGIEANTPMYVGQAMFRLLRNERLLDLAEQFVGPEIYSNPVQHVRMKLPNKVTDTDSARDYLAQPVPWHQDNGVVLPEADDTQTLTMWVPMTNTTTENGCMSVIPNSQLEGLVDHCPAAGTVGIPEKALTEEQMAAAVHLSMRPGSVLLMSRHTVHSSMDNFTDDQVRISLDLRYSPIGQPTGRPDFPGFVARSASAPETELHDATAWAQAWYDARRNLARKNEFTFNRWDGSAAVCA